MYFQKMQQVSNRSIRIEPQPARGAASQCRRPGTGGPERDFGWENSGFPLGPWLQFEKKLLLKSGFLWKWFYDWKLLVDEKLLVKLFLWFYG